MIGLWTTLRYFSIDQNFRISNNNHFNMNNISTLDIHWKDQCWSWSSNTLATLHKEPTHWKRPWCWGKIEGKRRRGRQRMRWLDGIMTQWTRVSANSRREWSLACGSSWGPKESGIIEQQNNNSNNALLILIYVFNKRATRIYILRIQSFKKILRQRKILYDVCINVNNNYINNLELSS